ncbi:MAG: hypothetical protein ACFFDS_02735 [Candidatus Thorarchaeota archaeon]
MNTPQKIVTGIALLAMAAISLGFDPWGASITRKVWDLISDLLAVMFVWGALYIFFSFIRRKKKDIETSSGGEI